METGRLGFWQTVWVSINFVHLPSSLWLGFLRALWTEGATATLTFTNNKTGEKILVEISYRSAKVVRPSEFAGDDGSKRAQWEMPA